MKLKVENLPHQSGNVTDVTAFSLHASSASHIIGMLTSQYSDPEMAFVRETCSNAYDAHVMANTEEIPFDLHIPTTFEPYVEIRDYGTGLSKEFMLKRYTAVGDSTKRDTNKQTGSFGIGRLSFLIVTEQAAITSYYNGKKYSYTVNYDAQGQLLISLTDERETDEPNGLRLKFPVQTNRVQAFRQAARKYFSRVSTTLPNFTGEELDIEPTRYSHKTDRWGVRTNGETGVIYAIMGNIAYPVRTDTLKYDSSFGDVRSLLESRIDLFFEIGEVIPLPTRENLDMCQQTLDALLVSLREVKQGLLDRLETQIAAAKNRYFAYKVWSEISQGASWEFQQVLNDLDLKYDGELVRKMKFDFKNVTREVPHPQASDDPNDPMFEKTLKKDALTFHSRRRSGYNAVNPTSWDKGYRRVSAKHENFLQHVFIYNDVKRGIRPTIDYNLPNVSTLVSLVSGPRDVWDEFVEREIKRGMNPRAFRYASKLLPKPKATKQKPKNVLIPVLGSSRVTGSGWKPWCNEVALDTLDGTQYYVETSNYHVDEDTQETYKLYRDYVSLGLLEPISIVVINKNRSQFIQEDWKPFSAYVKVCPKKVARKRSEVREALYIAMKRAAITDVLDDYFDEDTLVDKNYKYRPATSSRERVVTDSPLGALLKANRDVLLAVEDMRWLVGKIDARLETLRDSKSLTDFVSKVLNSKGWLWEDHYESLANAYELDYEALRNAALADIRGLEITREYRNSQLYLVVYNLGRDKSFDLNKLRKELSTN